MSGFPLSEADRDRVTAAVTAAEAGTDGEIVTIITQRSDEYRDTAWIWGIAAVLLLGAIVALWPWIIDAKLALFIDPWGKEPSSGLRFLMLLALQAVVLVLVQLGLGYRRLRIALTPPPTKWRRVARRANLCFKVAADQRTAQRVGILLYLSLDERRAEIVADQAIHGAVPAERWGEAMAALLDAVRDGRPADGLVDAIGRIGAIIGEHFPKTVGDLNELPDRLIEL